LVFVLFKFKKSNKEELLEYIPVKDSDDKLKEYSSEKILKYLEMFFMIILN